MLFSADHEPIRARFWDIFSDIKSINDVLLPPSAIVESSKDTPTLEDARSLRASSASSASARRVLLNPWIADRHDVESQYSENFTLNIHYI